MSRSLHPAVLIAFAVALVGMLAGDGLQRWWTAWTVRAAARGIAEPPTEVPVLVLRGAACFRDHCASCHGVPVAGALSDAAYRWRARELLWIVREGMPRHGMPGFAGRLDDADQWAVVAFVRQLPRMTEPRWLSWQRQVHGLPCPASGAPDVPPALRPAQPTRLLV